MTTTGNTIADRALNETDRILLTHMLKATGRPDEVIEPWLDVKPRHPHISGHAGEVVQWMTAFIPYEDQAVHWFHTDDIAGSLAFAASGWTPEQAAHLKREVFIQALRSDEGVSDVPDWLNSGLPPEFVFVCLKRNMASHHDAHAVYEAATSA